MKKDLQHLFDYLINNRLSKQQLDELLEGLDDESVRQCYEVYMKHHFDQVLHEHFESGNSPEGAHDSDSKVLPIGKSDQGKLNRVFRIAAVILILLVSTVVIWSTLNRENREDEIAQQSLQPASPVYVEKNSPRGARSTFTLHDGSIAHLNADSKIVLPEKFTSDGRRVQLTGQAYFDIERDEKRPFVISAQDLTIEVLGTAFDIKAYEEESQIAVTVESGKVKVYNASDADKPFFLIKDQKLVYDIPSASFAVTEVEAHKEMAWRYGVLRFNKTPVREVERLLERWYDVDILVSDEAIFSQTITGEHKNESLTSVLQSLSFALNARYTVDGKVVTISKDK
jgi:transmembrane sensor